MNNNIFWIFTEDYHWTEPAGFECGGKYFSGQIYTGNRNCGFVYCGY